MKMLSKRTARALAGLGLDHVCLITRGPWSADAVDTVGAAASRLAG